MPILLLILLGWLGWKITAPRRRFLPEFATLLEHGEITRGRFSVLSGRSDLRGTFRGRAVEVRFQVKTNEYNMGYLVVAMQLAVARSLDRGTLRAHAEQMGAGDLLDALSIDERLTVIVERGWLEATWMPMGFMIFPGRFDGTRWRRVLETMEALAARLER